MNEGHRSIIQKVCDGVRTRFQSLKRDLNEKARRRLAGAEAKVAGWGGITLVAEATGLSHPTIRKGLRELDADDDAPDRIRKEGGGRKQLVEKDPTLVQDLRRIIEPHVRGDPDSSLRWSSKAGRKVARGLLQKGHQVSASTVHRLFRKLRISLKALRKMMEGSKKNPDRNAQFEFIAAKIEQYRSAGNPSISTDSKKKELIGPFKNNGRERRSEFEDVNAYDYPYLADEKATPDGLFDLGRNEGFVNIGISKNTAAFNAETVRKWWNTMGEDAYPELTAILMTSDAGGSNGYRSWLWKNEVQELADEIGVPIEICHLPPGTSKWNKIEHGMFSYIAINWRGKALTSLTVMMNYITATTTETGLSIKCEIDLNAYETGLSVSKEERAAINIMRDEFHGEWNYTISPRLS